VRIIQGFDGWRDFWGATGIKIDLSKTHLVREIIKLIRLLGAFALVVTHAAIARNVVKKKVQKLV